MDEGQKPSEMLPDIVTEEVKITPDAPASEAPAESPAGSSGFQQISTYRDELNLIAGLMEQLVAMAAEAEDRERERLELLEENRRQNDKIIELLIAAIESGEGQGPKVPPGLFGLMSGLGPQGAQTKVTYSTSDGGASEPPATMPGATPPAAAPQPQQPEQPPQQPVDTQPVQAAAQEVASAATQAGQKSQEQLGSITQFLQGVVSGLMGVTQLSSELLASLSELDGEVKQSKQEIAALMAQNERMRMERGVGY